MGSFWLRARVQQRTEQREGKASQRAQEPGFSSISEWCRSRRETRLDPPRPRPGEFGAGKSARCISCSAGPHKDAEKGEYWMDDKCPILDEVWDREVGVAEGDLVPRHGCYLSFF